MAVFSGNPLSLKKRHCHWNKDFNGLHSQEKQGIQAHSPLSFPFSPVHCILGWVVGDRGDVCGPSGLGPDVDSPQSLDSPIIPFPFPPPHKSHSVAMLREEGTGTGRRIQESISQPGLA